VFEKLISWEMDSRGGRARAYAGKLIRKLWPDFRLSGFLLRTTGSQKEVVVNGRRMFVDLWDSAVSTHLFVSKTWEPEETKLVSSLLRAGDVFVDVGANVGYFTLVASEAVGSSGKVFAFEPEPGNFSLLRKNVQVNKCANVHCEQKAVTSANQPVELYLSSFNYGDHRIFPSRDDQDYNRGQQRQRTQVDGVTLDSYFPAETRVDFIKMDVQGAEYFALQGMKRVLRDNPNLVLMIEFWPHGLREAGVEPSLLLDELDRMGLLLHRIDGGKLLPHRKDDILPTPGDEAVNFVFSRRKLENTDQPPS
jgi:FkbM family methyltransferase